MALFSNQISPYFTVTPSRPSFLVLEEASDYDIQSAVNGKENRVGELNTPVDAVLTDNSGKSFSIQLHGCFYHCHSLASDDVHDSCHLPKSEITMSHLSQCETCQADRSSSNRRLRPRLWHLKEGENSFSKHPLKKISYAEIDQQTRDLNQSIRLSSLYDRHVEIYECFVTRFWERPLGEFFSFYNLSIKPQFSNILFCDVFYSVVRTHFPLLGSSGKLTMQKVLKYVKENKFNGFIKLTATLGSESKQFFSSCPPFAFVNEKRKLVNSFELKCQLLPTNFLRFFLSKELSGVTDFVVLGISDIYEYKIQPTAIFEKPANQAIKILEQVTEKNVLRTMLKGLTNHFCGALSVDLKNFPTAVLMHKEEFQTVHHLTNFIKSEMVSENYYISTFANRSPNLNLSHIHFQILMNAKLEMIKVYIFLNTYLRVAYLSYNTDGFSISMTCELKQNDSKYQALFLDQALKPSLSKQDITEYVNGKFSYIVNTNVCYTHKKEYTECLMNKTIFTPRICCEQFKNEKPQYKLNIEFVGDVAVILAKNRHCLYNSFTKERVTKCSGKYDPRFDSIESLSYDELKQLVSTSDNN